MTPVCVYVESVKLTLYTIVIEGRQAEAAVRQSQHTVTTPTGGHGLPSASKRAVREMHFFFE